MNKKDLYLEKMKAQLDELQAEVDKLKAKSAGASADVKIKIDHHLKEMQHKMKDGKEKIAEIAKSSDEAWESMKEGLDASWESLKHAFSEAASKFKKE